MTSGIISSLSLLDALLAALRFDKPRDIAEKVSNTTETSSSCSDSDSFCALDFDLLFTEGVEVEGFESEGRPRLDPLVDASAADA
jgi:hypothetical protein